VPAGQFLRPARLAALDTSTDTEQQRKEASQVAGYMQKFQGMPLLSAFANIIDELNQVNAADRQVTGMKAWMILTYNALQAASQVPGASEGFTCDYYGADTHLAWRISTASIVAALARQENQADAIRAAAESAAAAAEAEAAEAEAEAEEAQAEAAAAEAEAFAAEAAASSSDDDDAADAAADAAAAHARAEAAMERATAAMARAEDAYERAGAARELARRARWWQEQAAYARQFGENLIAWENAIHFPVAKAAQAAGLNETVRAKHYYRNG
jgi:hypothetical protein